MHLAKVPVIGAHDPYYCFSLLYQFRNHLTLPHPTHQRSFEILILLHLKLINDNVFGVFAKFLNYFRIDLSNLNDQVDFYYFERVRNRLLASK